MKEMIKMKDRYIGKTEHHNLGECEMYCDDERKVYYLINSKDEMQKIWV